MEKQEISSKNEFQEKYNVISLFLTRSLFGKSFEILRKVGLVDTYSQDPEIMNIVSLKENQRLLFLLFKNKKMSHEEIKKVILGLERDGVNIVFSYELVNEHCMVVLDFPEEYTKDYDYILKGKYSKLSDSFKELFPQHTHVFNSDNQIIGTQYSIYYHIFNKTEWLKNHWIKKLDLVELNDNLELWSSPGEKDIIFDIKTIIK